MVGKLKYFFMPRNVCLAVYKSQKALLELFIINKVDYEL